MDDVLKALREGLEAGERALSHLDSIKERRVVGAADVHISLGLDLIRAAIEERSPRPEAI